MHAAEDVAAELVGAEQVLPRRPDRRRERLGERIGRRDQRREDRDHDPGDRDHDADRRRAAGAGPGGSRRAVVGERRAEDAGGHVTRIRGSMTPYRMSTMKFTVT